MKTVFKKMLSLVLVAMLLVSAVPFQASADSDEYKITAEIYNENEELIKTGSFYVFTTSKLSWPLSQLLGGDWADKYEVIGYSVGNHYDGGATGNTQFGDYIKDNDTVYIEVKAKASTDGGNEGSGNEGSGNEGSGNTGSGNNGGNTGSGTFESYKLTVNNGDKITVYSGELYLDVLAARTPERPGQRFIGWFSDALGRIVNKNDQIFGNDNVTAKFSDPVQYNLTLDENRKGEEYVNRGKLVTYGEPIGDLYTPTREGYTFLGWKLNGKYIHEDTEWTLQGDGTAYAQWRLESDEEDEPMGGNTHIKDGEVYLEIYKNGNTKELIKRVKVTKYVEDNRISLSDAKAVAKKYVSAKSGYSLEFDGLFDEEAWWWYCRDEETDGKKSVIVNQDGDDYVYIMVKNVKSSSNADTSNPKTGDTIFMAVTVMALSASALAAAYVFNKKRAI